MALTSSVFATSESVDEKIILKSSCNRNISYDSTKQFMRSIVAVTWRLSGESRSFKSGSRSVTFLDWGSFSSDGCNKSAPEASKVESSSFNMRVRPQRALAMILSDRFASANRPFASLTQDCQFAKKISADELNQNGKTRCVWVSLSDSKLTGRSRWALDGGCLA